MGHLTRNETLASRLPGPDAAGLFDDVPTATRTVLVVEDEIVVSFFIRTLFEERGMRVVTATNAAEALEQIAAVGPTLGAAIIDVGLPDTPGDQLVAPIRALLPELPIVIATGFSETEFSRRFQEDARLCVVGKPFDAPQLWSALGTLDPAFADSGFA